MVLNEPFNKMIVKSIVFHISLLLMFTLKPIFFPSEPIDFRPSIRVDIVDLPDKIEKGPGPKAIEKKPEEKKVVEKKVVEKKIEKKKPVPLRRKLEKKVSLKKVKNEQDAALKRLKALQAIKERSNADKEKQKSEELKSRIYKGNVLSPGTALKGLNKIDYDGYIDELDKHIKSHWSLPKWLSDSNFKARVKVKFDERGYLLEKALVKSSGDASYDQLVMEAIEKSNPFPAPPLKFSNLVKIDGVVFGFPE